MLFTKASEYALLSLIYISQKNLPQDVDTMSYELNIPKSFLAKILQRLAKDKLLCSYRGAKGGFALSKAPKNYTIKEIINSAEKKDLSVFDCSGGICPSHREKNCSLMPIIIKLQDKIDDFLESLTLEDITKNNG